MTRLRASVAIVVVALSGCGRAETPPTPSASASESRLLQTPAALLLAKAEREEVIADVKRQQQFLREFSAALDNSRAELQRLTTQRDAIRSEMFQLNATKQHIEQETEALVRTRDVLTRQVKNEMLRRDQLTSQNAALVEDTKTRVMEELGKSLAAPRAPEPESSEACAVTTIDSDPAVISGEERTYAKGILREYLRDRYDGYRLEEFVSFNRSINQYLRRSYRYGGPCAMDVDVPQVGMSLVVTVYADPVSHRAYYQVSVSR